MQLLQAQTKRFANARQSMDAMLKEDVDTGHRVFVSEVSGQVKAKTLAALGHPFGRSAGGLQRTFSAAKGKQLGLKPRRAGIANVGGKAVAHGVLPGLPINVQTGRLRAAVVVTRAGRNAYGLASHVGYAKFVISPFGTKTMVTRTKRGRPLIGGKLIGGRTMGLLEQAHRINAKARRQALKAAHRSI